MTGTAVAARTAVHVANVTATAAAGVNATATARAVATASAVAAATATARAGGFFGPGTMLVGVDIAAGLYRSKNGASGCYWARLSGLGGTPNEIIASGEPLGPTIVQIASNDTAFRSDECALWQPEATSRRSSTIDPLSTGTFAVSTEVRSGQWRTAGGAACRWVRLGSFSGEPNGVIADGTATSPTVVVIEPTDVGFTSIRCPNWTRLG
jgi:hypothetical protein